MEEFVIRPALDGSGRPLIEFHGDHRSEKFPKVLSLLQQWLPEFRAHAEPPVCDDFIWKCSFSGGEFDLSDDWGGLFVIPKEQSEDVVSTVAAALENSGVFRRVPK
ncbi:hypothetical protein [Rhodoferax lithotrophicus]|uniref:hypothetical protein n=1 Tax=Rhodoferax lithotrophicus TaxID=2798804 RepID=UPI001CC54544|nr:hypothetical protein [Rhodoferax sp. MIZ03]